MGSRGPALRADARMILPSEDAYRMSCGDDGKRKMYRAWVPKIEGLWAPAVHSNCVHNEEAALRLRTLGATPVDPVYPALKKSFTRVAVLLKKLQVERWSLEEVVASYTGRLRRRYQEALEQLDMDRELTKYDKRLSAFLKAEKFNPLQKRSKPRMIMCRSPKFNLVLASYLKPLEHALWRRWKFGLGGVTPSRVVGKGLDGKGRADLIRRKMGDVGDCVVFEVDGKAFEAHVTRKQLLLEHGVYKAVYPNNPELNLLLECQLELKGKTAGGIKYSRKGCRASGDFNTGLGNTLIMGSAVDASLRLAQDRLGPFRVTQLADGDNALIFVERRIASELRQGFNSIVAEVVGQELTVEAPVTTLEEVTFGQCKPCYNGVNYTMVRHPFKVLSNAFCGYRHYDQKRFTGAYMKAVCQAEYALSRGIPVLQPYFAAMLDKLSGYRDLQNPDDYLEERLKYQDRHSKLSPGGDVSLASRISFEKSWGLGVEEQLSLERRLVESLESFVVGSHLGEEVLVGDGPEDDTTDLVGSMAGYFLGENGLNG